MRAGFFRACELYEADSCKSEEGNRGREGESKSEHGELIPFVDQYREIALNCFRYLDFKSFDEVDRLTLPEYELLIKAVELKEVDKDYRNHLQAFLNFAAKAQKKVGNRGKTRPVYSRFKKFYNYEDEIKKVKKAKDEKSRFSGIGKLL